MRMSLLHRLRAQDGFTMIIALGVMFVTGLILVAAFTVANGDVHSSHRSTLEKQAYYAALAGIQQYEAALQSEPNYWQTCTTLKSRVPEGNSAAEEKKLEEEERGERYVVKPVPATGQSACSTESPFTSMIESKGAVANTFRIRSTGTAGRQGSKSESAERSVIASFGVTGFLQYVYYTNFETIDPALYENSNKSLAEKCRGKYYKEWSKETGKPCEAEVINWVTGDHTEGPMHTNDAALVSGGATFGREKAEPKDQVEINGGTYGSSAGCASSAKYYTTTKCYTEKGPTLTPPPTDESLEFYVEESNRLRGVSKLVLKGSEIKDTYYTLSGGVYTKVEKTIPWPANGLLYIESNGTCEFEYEYEKADTSTEAEKEKGCANVYVEGVYEKSLTIASANDVIINGSIYPASVSGKLASSGSEATRPTGTAVLGLIANNFVRVYHPCSGFSESGIKDPWIYAGILATQHSFVVDNPGCGNQLGKLNVYGAIGQNYRGVVGTSGSSGTGYLKHYEYDSRLATDEPPFFLAPLKAGWKIVRETAQSPG